MTPFGLPAPEEETGVTVEEAIRKRRSHRSFTRKGLSQAQLGRLLWSAQGITDADGRKRAAPSAGATYPLNLYTVVGEDAVGGLEAGVYRYLPADNALALTGRGDVREELARAALGQVFMARAPVVLVFAADYSQTTGRYGERGRRYVEMEVGHASQNVSLQCSALGLATVCVGALRDQSVAEVLALPAGEDPLYLMPVGYPD